MNNTIKTTTDAAPVFERTLYNTAEATKLGRRFYHAEELTMLIMQYFNDNPESRPGSPTKQDWTALMATALAAGYLQGSRENHREEVRAERADDEALLLELYRKARPEVQSAVIRVLQP